MKPQLNFIDQRKKKVVPKAQLLSAQNEAQSFLEKTHSSMPGSLSQIWGEKHGEPFPERPGVYESGDGKYFRDVDMLFGTEMPTFDLDGHPLYFSEPAFNECLHSHINRLQVFLVDADQLPVKLGKQIIPIFDRDRLTKEKKRYNCPVFEAWGMYKSASSAPEQDDAIYISPERIWEGVKCDADSFIHYFTAVLTHEFAHALMAQPGQTFNEAALDKEEALANAFTLARYRAIKGLDDSATRMIETFMRHQPKPYCNCFEVLENANVNWIDWKLQKAAKFTCATN